MSNQKQPQQPALFRVPPPSELPNFITGVAVQPPQPPQQASDNLIKNEAEQSSENVLPVLPTSESGDFLSTTFSPAIPAIKGAPTERASGGNTSSEPTTPSSADSARLPSPPSLQSAHEADEYLGDPMPGSGLLTWVKGAVESNGLLHRVALKAKSSVNSLVTTLDPQMKEYINTGGDVEIVVASDKEDKVSAVREAFQTVFGKATVTGYPSQPTKIAAQPVGFAAALTAAKERIGQVRSESQTPTVALENFVVEISSERWFDLGVLVLNDPVKGISLETCTQMTPVPSTVIAAAKGDTPDDYEFKETGFSTTIGSYMAANLQVHHKHWHEAATGVSRRELILLAAKSLAGSYKKILSP